MITPPSCNGFLGKNTEINKSAEISAYSPLLLSILYNEDETLGREFNAVVGNVFNSFNLSLSNSLANSAFSSII